MIYTYSIFYIFEQNFLQMSEKCPQNVRKCQKSKEYKRFVEEFLIDIRATIAAMEEVCPVAKKKSLKSCPVFATKKAPATATATYLQNITFGGDISSTDKKSLSIETITHLPLTTGIEATQQTPYKQSVTNGNIFESVHFPGRNMKKNNIQMEVEKNLSLIIFGDIEDAMNLVWNASEKKSLKSENSSIEEKDKNDANKEVFLTVLITGGIVLMLVISALLCFAILYSRSGRSFRFLLSNQKIIRRL